MDFICHAIGIDSPSVAQLCLSQTSCLRIAGNIAEYEKIYIFFISCREIVWIGTMTALREDTPGKTRAQKSKYVACERDSRMGMLEHLIDSWESNR